MTTIHAPLDHYGRMATTWWATHRPEQWESLTDPDRFAMAISQSVQAEIAARQAELQATMPTAPSFEAHVTQIRETQRLAEELVLGEWFPMDGTTPGMPPADV